MSNPSNPTLAHTAASTTDQIVIPTGVVVQEYMVVHAMCPGTGSVTTPAGWTLLGSEVPANSAPNLYVFGRAAVAGDAGSTVTFTGASLLQFSGWQVVYTAGPFPTAGGSGSESAGLLSLASTAPTGAASGSTVVSAWAAQNATSSTAAASITVPATAVQAETQSTDLALAAAFVPEGTAPGTATITGTQVAGDYVYGTVLSVALPLQPAPYSATLTEPANASTVDLSGTPTFAWTYQPATGSGTQTDVAIRRKVAGASSYEFWSAASGAWQSTIVYFPDTNQSYTFPTGAWPDGNIYNWDVSTQESVWGLQSVFGGDATVTAQAAPSVVITGPTGTIPSGTPTVTATATVASGANLTAYRVVVYTAAQVAASGFTPGGTPSVYDSGTVPSSNLSISQPVPALVNNASYVTYVQVTESGNELSGWVSQGFTVSSDSPAQPSLSVATGTDPVTGAPLVTLTVTGHDNLLSTADASVEGSLGTWTAGANTTIADSTAQSLDGSSSMTLTATAAGSVTASTAAYGL